MASLILLFLNYFVIGCLLSFCSAPGWVFLLLILSIVPFYYENNNQEYFLFFAIFLLPIFLGLINEFNGLDINDIWAFFGVLVIEIFLGWLYLNFLSESKSKQEKVLRERKRIYKEENKVAKNIFNQAQKQLTTAQEFSRKAQTQLTKAQNSSEEEPNCLQAIFKTPFDKAQEQLTKAQKQLEKATPNLEKATQDLKKATQDLEEEEKKLQIKIKQKLTIFIPLVIGLSLFSSYLDQISSVKSETWYVSLFVFAIGFFLSGILALFSSTLLNDLQAEHFLTNKDNWLYKFFATFFSDQTIPKDFVTFTNFCLVLLIISVGMSSGSEFQSDKNGLFNQFFIVQQTFSPKDLLDTDKREELIELLSGIVPEQIVPEQDKAALTKKMESFTDQPLPQAEIYYMVALFNNEPEAKSLLEEELKPYRDDKKKNLTALNIKNILLKFPTKEELKKQLDSTLSPLSP